MDSHTTPDEKRRIRWEILDRYLAGDASAKEAADAEVYLQQCPRVKSYLRAASTILGEDAAREASWSAMQSRLEQDFPRRSTFSPDFATSKVSSPRWRLGVGLGLAAAAAVVWAIAISGRQHHEALQSQAQVYVTQAGERATVQLPDGSQASLAPATTLRVHTASREITVAIEGEAMFQVQQHLRVPFVVQTNRSVVRVLGTRFLVREYREDRVARIAVAEGRVTVQGVRDTISAATHSVLAAHALAVVDDSGRVNVTPKIAVDAYSGMTTGNLVFQKTQASDVVSDLSRAYDVKIAIQDSALAATPVNWKVQTSKFTLSQVLPELLMMLNAHARTDGNVITIIRGGTSTRSVPRGPKNSTFNRESQYGR